MLKLEVSNENPVQEKSCTGFFCAKLIQYFTAKDRYKGKILKVNILFKIYLYFFDEKVGKVFCGNLTQKPFSHRSI